MLALFFVFVYIEGLFNLYNVFIMSNMISLAIGLVIGLALAEFGIGLGDAKDFILSIYAELAK